jgi:two-component sensor histidine kinase
VAAQPFALGSMLYERIDVNAMATDDSPRQMDDLLATPDLADALESEQFKRFLDQIPIAIIVSELKEPERIVYVNPEFERLCLQTAAEVSGKPWSILDRHLSEEDIGCGLGAAVAETSDYVGVFRIDRPGQESALADAYSNLIQNDEGVPLFRLVALVNVSSHGKAERESLKEKIREKDTLLKEIQHRVKNNLQMITALIRLEARNARGDTSTARFDRLAGRIEALQFLYDSLSPDTDAKEIDLGVYLTQIASGVMRSYAGEGIRLDLKVDSYPVSVNVAMPTGLVVNELLTNALKHAFAGREGGTITLHSTANSKGCQVIIADDGVGLPPGVEWPKQGKLGTLVVKSLRENAKAAMTVESTPGKGMRVTIGFTRTAAAPES